MKVVVGNTASVLALTTEFPMVALLSGPTSVGKWAAAEQARRANKIFEPDVLRIHRLGVTEAAALIDFALTAAAGTHGRAAIIDLDGARRGPGAMLLTLLERPLPGLHVLLISSQPLPETLSSRARVYPFGLLSTPQVAYVLRHERGIAPPQATTLAQGSGGQVSAALDMLAVAEDKPLVLAAVAALRTRDTEALAGLADRWRAAHTTMLGRWAQEAVSGQWRWFTRAECADAGSLPIRVLLALRADVRPRLVVRSVLMDLVEER